MNTFDHADASYLEERNPSGGYLGLPEAGFGTESVAEELIRNSFRSNLAGIVSDLYNDAWVSGTKGITDDDPEMESMYVERIISAFDACLAAMATPLPIAADGKPVLIGDILSCGVNGIQKAAGVNASTVFFVEADGADVFVDAVPAADCRHIPGAHGDLFKLGDTSGQEG